MSDIEVSIEEERRSAEGFALRAAMLEKLNYHGVAQTFRDLVDVCDQKISILRTLAICDSLHNPDAIQAFRTFERAERLKHKQVFPKAG